MKKKPSLRQRLFGEKNSNSAPQQERKLLLESLEQRLLYSAAPIDADPGAASEPETEPVVAEQAPATPGTSDDQAVNPWDEATHVFPTAPEPTTPENDLLVSTTPETEVTQSLAVGEWEVFTLATEAPQPTEQWVSASPEGSVILTDAEVESLAEEAAQRWAETGLTEETDSLGPGYLPNRRSRRELPWCDGRLCHHDRRRRCRARLVRR